MGRHATGHWTTNDARELNLSRLMESDLFRPGCNTTVHWTWRRGKKQTAGIELSVCYSDAVPYLRLRYSMVRQGVATHLDYNIQLRAKPSNLGAGQVFYFVCPASDRLCRKLYLAYDSHVFKCRQAYQTRLYYPLQKSSKMQRWNDRCHHLEAKIKEMQKGRAAFHYAGKLTKRALRLGRLYQKHDLAETMTWQPENFPLSLRKIFVGLDD
jgi:hypothetical protein